MLARYEIYDINQLQSFVVTSTNVMEKMQHVACNELGVLRLCKIACFQCRQLDEQNQLKINLSSGSSNAYF